MAILFDLDDTLLDHRAAFHADTAALDERVQFDWSLDDFMVDWELQWSLYCSAAPLMMRSMRSVLLQRALPQ